MKIKVGEMMMAFRAATMLSGKTMPARASYWVMRLIAKLRSEYEVAEEKRQELVKKHGREIKSEGGTAPSGWEVPSEKLPEFDAEFKPISEEEIDIDVKPLRIECFDGVQLRPADLMALDHFLTEAE